MIFDPTFPARHYPSSLTLCGFSDEYTAPHAFERVLPTGEMSLIINLHEDRTRVYDPADLTRIARR